MHYKLKLSTTVVDDDEDDYSVDDDVEMWPSLFTCHGNVGLTFTCHGNVGLNLHIPWKWDLHCSNAIGI